MTLFIKEKKNRKIYTEAQKTPNSPNSRKAHAKGIKYPASTTLQNHTNTTSLASA